MTITGAPPQTRTWVGRSVRRVEDPKLLAGRGGYVDDIERPGMLHAAVLRSPHPHARIASVDADAARALPGVVAVVTGAEAAELCGPLPDASPQPDKQVWRVLAADKVRYAGEGVAAVVAESRYVAEDACALIDVRYEPLAPLVDPVAAAKPGAPLVHEALGTNVAYERTFLFGDVERDFAEADLVVREHLRWGRSSGQPLETVGAVAEYDLASGMLRIHANSVTFTYFLFRLAETLRVPANKLDVVGVPAGGSFGSKLSCYRVLALTGMLAKLVGRPVKFVEDRLDNIANGDSHGSDRIYDVELAVMRDGTLRSLRIDVLDDYGAYMQFGVATHGNALAQVTGPYRIQSVQYALRAVHTNKCQQGGYRGFGSECTNWVLERVVDRAARELGLDPVEIRRANFIAPDAFPYFIPTGNMYDSGDYEGALDKALALADYDGWRAEQRRLRAAGRHVGIGIVSCQERSVFSATEFWFWFDDPGAELTSTPESVTLTVEPTGEITVTLYSLPFWGNSSDTMAVQLVAEELDVDPATVSVSYHGSHGGLPAIGPGGSRLTVMLAGAIHGAAEKIRAKAARIAAHLLDVDVGELEWVDGGFQVRGAAGSRASLADIAMTAYLLKHSLPDDIESGLQASKVYDHPHTTLPSDDRTNLGVFYPCMGHACHIAMVDVDVETGVVAHLGYVAVHDAGTMVNPRSLEGQIIGGTAQGVGTALMEEIVYDDAGRLATPSFAEYTIPSALDVPEVAVGHQETPSPLTVHGIKGGGEAGRLMAPAALSAAIDDALADYGVTCDQLPATPERILGWIEAARR